MRLWTTLLAAAALAGGALLGPQAARAEGPPPDFTRDGWYLQAQGVYAFELFDDFEVGNDAGFNVLAGWRGGRNFAAELEFEWINRFPGAGNDPDFRVFDLGLLFRVYPLARIFEPSSIFNRFQPYLKAGPGYMWVERRAGGLSNRDRGGFAARFGAGIDFYVTQHWVLTTGASYMLPVSDISRFEYLTAGGGIQYRFGGGGE